MKETNLIKELKSKHNKKNGETQKNKNLRIGKELKYLNRYKETPKESQTDRKIDYGKFNHKIKGSFKTNSNIMLGNNKSTNQMLNNIYKKKHKSPHRENYKSNSILENFSKNKFTESNFGLKKKKNFIVDSGSNDQFANNRMLYNKGKL